MRYKRDSSATTKEQILENGLSMMNETGVMDFRIDVLALALKLSPGNITYHYARKEDIVTALWHRYIEQTEQIASSISSLLDVKQAYLLLLSLCNSCYNNRGVVMFVLGDKRVINDKNYDTDHYFSIIKSVYDQITEILTENGYIKSTTELNWAQQMLTSGWWINLCALNEQVSKRKLDKSEMAIWAAVQLYTLAPSFSERGKEQFEFLKSKELKTK